MGTFNEELIAARKAKGMTQEQLAEAMNASRSAVSHWESGRSAPDYATIAQLSTVLGVVFSVQVAPQAASEPAANSAEQAQQTAAAPAKSRLNKRVIAAAVIALVVVLACCIVLPRLLNKPQAAALENTAPAMLNDVVPSKANSIEWYASDVQPESGKPFVAVQFSESPLRVTRNENLEWLYTVYLTEKNGYALNMNRIDLVIFKAKHEPDIFSYDANALDEDEWFGDHVIPANGQYLFNGGMPFSTNIVGVGVCVTGTDESGAEHEFHAYLPFSQEMKE